MYSLPLTTDGQWQTIFQKATFSSFGSNLSHMENVLVNLGKVIEMIRQETGDYSRSSSLKTDAIKNNKRISIPSS